MRSWTHGAFRALALAVVVPGVSLLSSGCGHSSGSTASHGGVSASATATIDPWAVLGSAETFAIVAGTTVTNTGATIINGSLGLSPGTAITGFPPASVSEGTIHLGDAVALQAQSDVTTAYNVLASAPSNTDLTGKDLGGMTLTPGVYTFSSSAQLTGVLTLDDRGDGNGVFIFQIGSTLTTAPNSYVRMINPDMICGHAVFWQVGSSATLGTGTFFEGSILALTSITLETGARIIEGRALARNGAVTLDANDVQVPIK
jgi:hypothetical protein